MAKSTYINSVLGAGENVLYTAQVSNWSQLIFYILTVILFPFGLIFLAVTIIRIKTTELAITNKKVIAKTGFIQRNTIEILLHKVESVQVHQSILGRMLNYGTIVVSGAGNPQAPIKGISVPIKFRKQCMDIQEQAEGHTASTIEVPPKLHTEATSTPPQKDPKETAAKWREEGRKLLKENKFNEAISTLSASIESNADNGATFYLRAVAYSKVKDNKNMMADLETAVNLGDQKAKETLDKLKTK